MSNEPTEPGAAYQVVEAYGPRRFRISGEVYETAVLVFAEHTQIWTPKNFDDLTPDDFAPVIAAASGIEILLLGCGERMEMVPQALRAPLREVGIVLEPMDTGAAARTFNLLLSEDRRVAAALLVLPADQQ